MDESSFLLFKLTMTQFLFKGSKSIRISSSFLMKDHIKKKMILKALRRIFFIGPANTMRIILVSHPIDHCQNPSLRAMVFYSEMNPS